MSFSKQRINDIIKSVSGIKDMLLDILYPNDAICMLCRKRKPSNRFYLCRACEASLTEMTEEQKCYGFPLARPKGMENSSAFDIFPFEVLYSAYAYDKFAKYMVAKYKKHRRGCLSFCFSKMLIELIDEKIDMGIIDAVCYIPSTKRKKSIRGFDSIGEIAKKISKHYNVELLDIIGVKKSLKEQKKLGSESRKENTDGAFFLKYELKKQGKQPIRVLLIDDIITTGSTMESTARCLKQSSILVYGVTVFRTIHF